MQALDDLGIDDENGLAIGICASTRSAVTWPLEPEGVRVRRRAGRNPGGGRKRQVIEYQLKGTTVQLARRRAPRVIRQVRRKGEWVLPDRAATGCCRPTGELTPAMIARVIARRIGRYFTQPVHRDRLACFGRKTRMQLPRGDSARAVPTSPGCPHNTGTRLPDGSAVAGIGCHYMATWMDPSTKTYFTQMGGEGVPWSASHRSPRHRTFSPTSATAPTSIPAFAGDPGGSGGQRQHHLQDFLYNDAVAMTGGQHVDGTLTVPILTRQLA